MNAHFFFQEEDKFYMKQALLWGKKGALMDEVPVGAVLVLQTEEGTKTFGAHNQTHAEKDPTAHAEILVIREASKALGLFSLQKAKLYVTLEPCIMCAGAISLARLGEVNFGLKEPKGGAVRSRYSLLEESPKEAPILVHEGLMEQESQKLLQQFFQSKRSFL